MKICICTTPIRPEPTTFPPFGSIAIIQFLRDIGEDVYFYHIDYHRYSHEEIEKYFEENKFDLVGISAVVSTAYAYTKYLTNLIQKVSKNTKIFVGGNLAASAHILHHKSNVDYCVIGDGEIIVQNLIRAIKENKLGDDDLSSILGITYLDSKGNFKFTGNDHPLPAEMIKRPDYDILEKDNSINHYIGNPDFEAYIPGYKYENNKKMATVVVAKGCVARCTFCHRFEKGYRVSPTESIINHMIMLKRKHNVKYIEIGDENFGSYKKDTISLVEQMGKHGFKLLASGVRAHTVDTEMLKFWKKNGCEIVVFGIESGSPTMLKIMEKKIKLEQNIAALKSTYEAGLATITQLVIGMPGETDQTINETIDFVITTLPYTHENRKKTMNLAISINYAQALPGTPLYEYARENGYIGKDIQSEEEYLIDVSDKNASEGNQYINYSQQPLLKVLSWKYQILWETFRAHYHINVQLNPSKIKIFFSIPIYIINKLFNFNLKYPIEKEIKNKVNDYNKNTINLLSLGRLLLPWSKFTYLVIILIIAKKESKTLRQFISHIIEHIKWNLSYFNKNLLPDNTLRKSVDINDTDDTLKLRMGR